MMRLAILVSGRGSNMDAILNNIENGMIEATPVLVLSDKPMAAALDKAKNRNIPTCVVERKNYPTKLSFNEAILTELQKARAELIVLAGYMRLVGEPILSAYEGRIVNIHPALLPSFPGLDGQKQAIDYGVRISGCTVHFVDSGMDTGRIIAQKAVPVYPDDNEDTLSARILEQEHILYSEVLKDLTRGKIVLENGKVKYLS